MSDPNHGPLMLCATRILKPPPTTIVKIGPNMNLPRPVTVRAAIAAFVGALPGVIIGLAIAGFQGLLFGMVFGGMIGVGLVTWEPQKGETLGKILGVAAQSRIRRRPLQLNGETVSLSIGIARISRVNEGWVHILPGAVPVNPNEYDERGVYRSAENRNELPFAERVAGLAGRGAFPDDDGPQLRLPDPEPGAAPAVEVELHPEVVEPPTFTIPVPGAAAGTPEPAPVKGRRHRRRKGEPTLDDLAAPIPADSSSSGHRPPPAAQEPPTRHPASAPDGNPAGVGWPPPHEAPRAAPIAAPTGVQATPEHTPTAPAAPGTPASHEGFTIPAPGAAAGGEQPARMRRKRRRDNEGGDTTAQAANPLPPQQSPVDAVPQLAAPVPSGVPAPPEPPRRRRRRGDDGERSVLDAWPDPLG